VYFTTVAFLPLLQKASEKRGKLHASVIVISSMSGIMRHAQGHFSYNAAKGATAHLTKLMSAEFQKLDLRVNSIAPGYFPSEMTTQESGEDQKSHLPDEKVQEKGHVPMQRGGTDQEMAMAVVSHCFHSLACLSERVTDLDCLFLAVSHKEYVCQW
jgi:NAD(P)-dependent dehydrogenase (short-subunit alcohol dehydrogenase family)